MHSSKHQISMTLTSIIQEEKNLSPKKKILSTSTDKKEKDKNPHNPIH